MNAMLESAERPSSQRISDPLEKAVILITDAMQTDYPSFFHQAYPGDEEIRQLKRRLYVKLRGIEDRCIYDGYEMCVAQKPNYLPTVPEIIAGALAAEKNYKRIEKNLHEAASLPAPKSAAMPKNIKAMYAEILKNASPNGENLEKVAEQHEALIADHMRAGKIRIPRPAKYLCACCGRDGVLSHSVNGGGNWYCSDHFQRVA